MRPVQLKNKVNKDLQHKIMVIKIQSGDPYWSSCVQYRF